MVEGEQVCLLIPLTYMNNSGGAVRQVVKEMGLSPEDILVVCDDFNLDFQKLRLRAKGSDGGHNGLHSIIEKLETEHFARLRMGIGRPVNKQDTVDYVLAEFSKKERGSLDDFIEEAVSCSCRWLHDGVGAAMEAYNRKS